MSGAGQRRNRECELKPRGPDATQLWGAALTSPAPVSCSLCFTKQCSAVMSQPGHRVSQLPQRLPDALRRGLRGQTPQTSAYIAK